MPTSALVRPTISSGCFRRTAAIIVGPTPNMFWMPVVPRTMDYSNYNYYKPVIALSNSGITDIIYIEKAKINARSSYSNQNEWFVTAQFYRQSFIGMLFATEFFYIPGHCPKHGFAIPQLLLCCQLNDLIRPRTTIT